MSPAHFSFGNAYLFHCIMQLRYNLYYALIAELPELFRVNYQVWYSSLRKASQVSSSVSYLQVWLGRVTWDHKSNMSQTRSSVLWNTEKKHLNFFSFLILFHIRQTIYLSAVQNPWHFIVGSIINVLREKDWLKTCF